MSCRRYGSKTTIAFWMLVAIVDAAMLVASAGPVVLLSAMVGLALLCGVAAVRLVTRRQVATTKVVVRRRA